MTRLWHELAALLARRREANAIRRRLRTWVSPPIA